MPNFFTALDHECSGTYGHRSFSGQDGIKLCCMWVIKLNHMQIYKLVTQIFIIYFLIKNLSLP